jgi:hypothetical protein
VNIYPQECENRSRRTRRWQTAKLYKRLLKDRYWQRHTSRIL